MNELTMADVVGELDAVFRELHHHKAAPVVRHLGRLRSMLVSVGAQIENTIDELAETKQQLKTATEANGDRVGYWVWQGDGEDHLESLTCPIMIRPEQLREIFATLNERAV